jgi:hypothetical protein
VYGAFTSIWCKDFDLAGSVPEFKFLISVILFVFFCNQRVFVCACVFFPPLSRVFGVYREIVGFGRVSLLLNL